MKAVEFVLGYVVSNKNVEDSDSEQDFSDSDFSDTKGIKNTNPKQKAY